MRENCLEVRLEAEKQRVGQFMLTAEAVSAHYAVSLDPEGSFALSDALRRLGPVLAGRGDPAGQMAPLDLMRDVGVRLWQSLLPDTAPAQECEALTQALRNGLSSLLLTLPDALAALPWELLCDPDVPGEQGFLARRRPLVRFLASDSSLAPLAPPLRVLLLISSPISLGEDSRVDVESERTAVEEAAREAREAGWLHLLVEDIVTPRRVQEALMRFRPHILHYIGHGAYDEKVGGVLLWEDDAGKELPIAASRLADLLRPRGLRAVVLHACQTARRDAHTDSLGVAGTLVKVGIPAVLAQQANFSYASSQLASKTWYQALTAGYSCAEALFEVRQALVQDEHPDWAVPVLYGSAASLTPLLDPAAPAGDPDSRLTSQSRALSLPTPTGVFVGRHRELRELHLMLEHSPGRGPVLALITGPGGVGKSTLAAQTVTRYSARYKAALTLPCAGYQDFTLSVLKPIAEFLKSQGVPGLLDAILPDPTLSTAAKMDQAIAALNSAGPFLLIVDNLESVQNEDHTLRDGDLLLFLQKLLANLRGSRVLLTGRYAVQGLLPDGKFAAHVQHLGLDDLSPYETDRLIAHHPSLAQLGEEVRQTLIREFGGLPYVYDLLSSEAASQNLDLLLHDMQGRITSERQQRSAQEWNTIRQRVIEFVALGAAVARLSASSRTLLGRLSVLRRPFPLDALIQGLSASRPDWQALLDWSLLRYDSTASTYRLHSLTRRYAQDSLLTEQERVQTEAQLAAWYEHYSKHDSHNMVDALEAHYLYGASGDVQHAAELVLELAEPLRRFGLYSLLRELCTMTVQDMHERDESLMAVALHELGILAYLQGDYPEARRLYQQSLHLAEQLGDLTGQARSWHQLGMLAQQQGDYPEAHRLLHQSLEMKERLGDVAGQAVSWHQLGILAQDQGNYPEARQLYQQSLQLEEQLGDLAGQASSWHQLGNLAYLQGDYPEAHSLLHQSLEMAEQLGNVAGQAISLHCLGMLVQEQGDYAEARRLYQQSLEMKERLGDVAGQAASWHGLGILAKEQGDYPEAHRLYQRSLEIAERLDDVAGQATLLHNLGILAQLQGNYPEARHLYQQSLEMKERLGDLAGQAASWHGLGMLAQRQWDYPEALRLYQQSLAISEQLGNLAGQANSLGQIGVMAYEQGNFEQALTSMVQAFLLFEKLRAPGSAIARRMIATIREQMEEATFLARWRALAGNLPVPALPQEPSEEAPSSMTLEDVLNAVGNALLHGTSEKREQLATALVEAQHQLPPSEAAVGRFLACLAAALRSETPDLTSLEAPFTELWQQFQQALQTLGSEQDQHEPE